MTKRRKYSGKYPYRIRAVYTANLADGTRRAGMRVETNDGLRYQIIPLTHAGRIHAPKLGEEIWQYLTSADYKVEL